MSDEFGVESVYAELLSRAPESKIEPRMAPLFRAMEILGEPNKAFASIHITGTNGKTSTARMIDAGLRAHGLRTGRYTSPHLTKVTERISIDGEPVADGTFVRIWDEIRPYLEIVDQELNAAGEPRLTYFECMTILAIAVFADEPVEVAVVEVGLGGITDATNVIDGQVSVVTPISLDHTDLLGDTVEDIAYEKAGIIKPGGFLVSAAQPVEAAQVLLEKAREVRVPFRFEGVEFAAESRLLAVGGQQVTVSGLAGPTRTCCCRCMVPIRHRTLRWQWLRWRLSWAAGRSRWTWRSSARPSVPSPPRAGSRWSVRHRRSLSMPPTTPTACG